MESNKTTLELNLCQLKTIQRALVPAYEAITNEKKNLDDTYNLVCKAITTVNR
jgi:hypothetical protein